jgi:hypothetical protein
MNQGPRIQPVHATLLPACSIEAKLVLPGWHEPRPIGLAGGDRTDELAREHIARHIRWIEGQRRYRRYEQEQQRQAAPALAAYEPYAC